MVNLNIHGYYIYSRKFMVRFYCRHFVLGPLFIMASICIEFWVDHVQHRVYAMYPDHYASRSVTEIETLECLCE